MSRNATLDDLKRQIASIESSSAPVKKQKRKQKQERADEDISSAEKAFKKIVALVNASDKSERAIRMRLQQAEFEESDIEEAVQRAKDYGFIDDMRYAEVLIRSRVSQGRGMRGIERELLESDIDPELVPGWPYEYGITDETEFQRALDLLKRNPPRSKNLREGAYRKLVTKGFSSSVASSAARVWSESQPS